MPVEQAAEVRPDDAWADAKAAYDELTKGAADTPEEKPEVEAEPEAKPEVKEDADGRLRGPDGKFAPKEKDEPEVKADPVAKPEVKPEAAKVEQPAQQAAPVEQAAPAQAGSPPPGWSVKSKSEWDKLPENIRADIAKREQEVSDGFKQYSGMKELMPYVEMAQRSGTTLKAALDNYTGIENLLRQDPIRGLRQVAANMGIDPQTLAAAFAPQQPSQPADPSNAQPFDPSILQQYINPLTQELTTLKHQLTQQQQAEQARQQSVINTALERFKSDPAHRYFENVEPLMSQLISSGIVPRTGDHMADLKAAYDAACYQSPEVRDLLIKEQIAKDEAGRKQREKDAAEKARQASRSITGTPSAAVQENTGKRGSPHDDARAAFNEVMARV